MARRRKKIKKKLKKGLFNFGLLSAVNFFGNILLTMLFHEVWGFEQQAAFALALFVLFLVNFLLFRYVVYKSKRMKIQKQFTRYAITTVAVQIGEFLLFQQVLRQDVDYRIAVIAVTLVAMLIRYLIFKHSVFKK